MSQLWAPTTKYQMPGITRQNTIDLCKAEGIPVRELDFSLTKVCVQCVCTARGGSHVLARDSIVRA